MSEHQADQSCPCLTEPQPFYGYEDIADLGVDPTNGRYGVVTLKRCKACDRYWLHYFVEYEAFSRSGRYFMGLITPEIAQALAPEAAVTYLSALDWYFYGGSYFDGRNGKTRGYVQAD